MTQVQYPGLRWQVMCALASLADRDYQERAWLAGQLPPNTYYDMVNEHIHVLFDDQQVLPDPEDAIGPILLDGDEISLLRALGREFDAVIDRCSGQYEEAYLRDESWDVVVDLARRALAAMVRRGGLFALSEA